MRIKNRSPFQAKGRTAYRVENKSDETTVYIYDEISYWGVDAQEFVKDFNKIDAKTINLRVNSPGGSVFDGTTIFNAIKQHKSHTIAHIDGLAASIASVIVLAADEVKMAENAFMMIHEPWSIMAGGADEMRKEAELLDKIKGTIAKAYMDKTGKGEKEIFELMAEETWLTSEEALEAGFIDSISDESKEKASATLFDLSVFDKVPDKLKETEQEITARVIEDALRDAGCSRKQAKVILAEGFESTDQRDADTNDVTPKGDDTDQRDADTLSDPPKIDRVAALLIRANTLN